MSPLAVPLSMREPAYPEVLYSLPMRRISRSNKVVIIEIRSLG